MFLSATVNSLSTAPAPIVRSSPVTTSPRTIVVSVSGSKSSPTRITPSHSNRAPYVLSLFKMINKPVPVMSVRLAWAPPRIYVAYVVRPSRSLLRLPQPTNGLASSTPAPVRQ